MEVLRLLGKGAFGHVYAVKAPKHANPVALKIMNVEVASQSMQRRFQREAEVIQRLESKYVPAIYDFGTQDDDSPFILMELLQGKTLRELLEEEVRLPWRRVVELGLQACEALHLAHSVGVLHRDLKPDNLFVVGPPGEERLKILDFGVATFVSGHTDHHGSLTQTSAIVGTPHYMSPEQIRSTKVGVEADIYMLGVVLYECLTGHRPFGGEFLGDLLGRVLSGHYRPIASHAPATPRVLAKAVERAMSLLPEMRFSSATAFADALSESEGANSEPPPKPTVSPGGTASRDVVDANKATLPATGFGPQPGYVAPLDSALRDSVSSTDGSLAQPHSSRRLGLLALGAVVFVMLTSAATYLIATGERSTPPAVAAPRADQAPATPAELDSTGLDGTGLDSTEQNAAGAGMHASEPEVDVPRGLPTPPLEEPSQMVQVRPRSRPTSLREAEPEPPIEVEASEPEVEAEPTTPLDGLINPFE